MSAQGTAKYQRIAEELRCQILNNRLRPGDPLPSQRELADRYGVALMTVRQTLATLRREGLIESTQGRGTFVTEPRPRPRCQRRLGLLLVDMGRRESSFFQSLSLAMLERVREAGYELIVDRIDIEQLVIGELPAMIRRRSVDGLFIYGWVGDHHFRFLANQPLPYMLLGNRPVSPRVPQIVSNFEQLAYQLTRALYQSGRSRIWLDADPTRTDYSVSLDLLRGYRRAVQEQGEGEGALHLCPLRVDRIGEAVATLRDTDLGDAALIVEDWSASLLLMALAAQVPDAERLLVVPIPSESLRHMVLGPNVASWNQHLSADLIVAPAVEEMVDAVEQGRPRPHSFEVSLTCEFVEQSPAPRMNLRTTIHRLDPRDRYEAEPASAKACFP